MSAAAADRMLDMVSDIRGTDVTPALIDRLREDFVIVRHALNRIGAASDAKAIEASLTALSRARGDRAIELRRLVDAIYGARISLS